MCNRKRRHFTDYPSDTFTFAKHDDYELSSAGGGRAAFTSGLFATGSSSVLTSVSGSAEHLDKNTLPVRWESPDVIASTRGQQWPRRLNVGHTGSRFGPKKSRSWTRVENEMAEVEEQRRRSSLVVADVHALNTSNYCSGQRAGKTSGTRTTTWTTSDEPPLPLYLPDHDGVPKFQLSDEFCLKVVDEAFSGIVYAP